jgi:predicted MFS family arabinose efflux permease
MASLSMVIAENIGWRAMMFVCAIVGGSMAVLMIMTVSEPARQGLKKKDDDKVKDI